MRNDELITEFIKGKKKYNAVNHLMYAKDELVNYSTTICKIDRTAKIALINSRKYSVTTSRIQSELRYQLRMNDFTIKEVDGEPAYFWNYGYQGAPTLTHKDAERRYYCNL